MIHIYAQVLGIISRPTLGFVLLNSKRSIGKKSISIIRPNNEPHKECCIFEGFFDMLTYASIKKWITGNELCLPHECDYLVLNSVSNIKVLMP